MNKPNNCLDQRILDANQPLKMARILKHTVYLYTWPFLFLTLPSICCCLCTTAQFSLACESLFVSERSTSHFQMTIGSHTFIIFFLLLLIPSYILTLSWEKKTVEQFKCMISLSISITIRTQRTQSVWTSLGVYVDP